MLAKGPTLSHFQPNPRNVATYNAKGGSKRSNPDSGERSWVKVAKHKASGHHSGARGGPKAATTPSGTVVGSTRTAWNDFCKAQKPPLCFGCHQPGHRLGDMVGNRHVCPRHGKSVNEAPPGFRA
jgi:hypothetical protein